MSSRTIFRIFEARLSTPCSFSSPSRGPVSGEGTAENSAISMFLGLYHVDAEWGRTSDQRTLKYACPQRLSPWSERCFNRQVFSLGFLLASSPSVALVSRCSSWAFVEARTKLSSEKRFSRSPRGIRAAGRMISKVLNSP